MAEDEGAAAAAAASRALCSALLMDVLTPTQKMQPANGSPSTRRSTVIARSFSCKLNTRRAHLACAGPRAVWRQPCRSGPPQTTQDIGEGYGRDRSTVKRRKGRHQDGACARLAHMCATANYWAAARIAGQVAIAGQSRRGGRKGAPS